MNYEILIPIYRNNVEIFNFKVGHYYNDFLVKFMCNSSVTQELRQANETAADGRSKIILLKVKINAKFH